MFGLGRTPSDKSRSASERRREELRRNVPRPGPDFLELARRPDFVTTVLVTLAAAIGVALTIALSRDLPRAYPGEIATQSRVNPRDYSVENKAATKEAREAAEHAAPRYYLANATYLAAIRAAIEGLPVATFEKTDLGSIKPELVARFDLTTDSLRELQRFGGPKTASDSWREWCDRFLGLLWSEEPLVSAQEYQVFATTVDRRVAPPQTDKGTAPTPTTAVASEPQQVRMAHELPEGDAPMAIDGDVRRALLRMAREAGFPEGLAFNVAAAVANDPHPTIAFDEARTKRAAAEAAAKVPQSFEKHPRGEVIYSEGDVLGAATIERYEQSAGNEAATRGWGERLSSLAGALGFGLAITLLVLFYAARHEPRLSRRPQRLAGLFGLMVAPAVIACVTSASFPIVTLPVGTAAVLLVSAMTVLAYGQRFALFIGALEALLLTLALDVEETTCLVFILGCGTLVTLLRDVRHRATIVRASGGTAVVLFLGFALLGLFETRLATNSWMQILRDAFLSAMAAYAIGFLVLGILPTIERLFRVTTGLTLAELRDPRHPLLRQMQERAPGTYSHSLQVANLAEAAADAIGADGLLAFAGGLYHDIGKINKPEYFVENQLGAANKHERLSPAMSLLVIVGHVKDGLELAKEYGLPKPLHHFVESHHGTTLVEYFFRRACTEAEKKGDGEDSVEEFDFRYPGPKPRTKEAAIVMLSDASESASRAIAEPTHGRIEALVRALARKRLDDGQLDECPMTFAELRVVEDTLIKSLAAIHHGRIAYPSTTTIATARA